jgi:CubicO group peptidase (beta-lactamase class C family)
MALVPLAAAADDRELEAGESFDSRWQAGIVRYFGDLESTSDPGCVVGVADGERLIAERAFGLANLEHRVPLSTSSVFETGSLAKQFTAASIALLYLEGRLQLDADVRDILPSLPEYGHTVSVWNLLYHSSGIPDVYGPLEQVFGDEDGNFYPSKYALQAIRNTAQLNFPPGQDFEYSNAGYLLLAEIVEKVSGLTLAAFVEQRIFSPLGMVDTHFHDNHRKLVPSKAYGYGRTAAGDWETRESNFEVVGDGGLYTTLGDLTRWQANFAHDRLAAQPGKWVELMERPAQYERNGPILGGIDVDYSFGLITWTIDGRKAIGHRGSWAGFRAAVLRYPAEQISLIALCNFAEADPLDRLFNLSEHAFEPNH